MSIETTYNLDNPANFVHDTSVVEISAVDDVARLLVNPNATFGATWRTTGDVDADIGDGVLTGTPLNGADAWNGLDCRGDLVVGVTYAGVGNADTAIQTGTIRIRFAPNYSGSPSANKTLYQVQEPRPPGFTANRISLVHTTSGLLQVDIRDSSDSVILQASGAYSATPGVVTEVELDFDITLGSTRIFLDGTQLGSTNTGTGTRDTNVVIYVGTSPFNPSSDFVIENIAIFDAVKHTANYVPAEIDLSDTDLTFYAAYDDITSIDATQGNGDLTGTAVGAVRVVKGLDIEGNSGKQVSFDGDSNVSNAVQVGAIQFKLRPNYSGTPTTTQRFFQIQRTSGNDANQIQLEQNSTSGDLDLTMLSNNGTTIVSISRPLATTFVAGTEYLMELNWDISSGATRLFQDGVQLGAVDVSTGTRNTNTTFFVVGTTVGGVGTDCFVRDFAVYDAVQHTADYDPAGAGVLVSTDGPVIKPNATVDTDGILAYSEVATTPTNTEVRHVQEINGVDQYFDGASWVASDGSIAQSNLASVVNANLSSLDVSAGVRYRPGFLLISEDGIATPELTSVTHSTDFFAFESDASALRTVIVRSFTKLADGTPVEGIPWKVFFDGFQHGDHTITKTFLTGVSGVDGLIDFVLVETETINLSPYSIIINETQFDNWQAPDQVNASLGTIVVNP